MVEGARLESVCSVNYRGFKSLPLRNFRNIMSKLEIEAKVLEIDKDSVIAKLENLGAIKIFDDELCAIYYYKDGIINQNNALRLRKEGKEIVLTHKEKIGVDEISKSFDETEVSIGDFDTMNKILHSLGFEDLSRNRKRRISYKLDDTRFEIDEYMDEYGNIPVFLEIEASDNALIQFYIEKLELGDLKIVNYNFFELVKYYNEV